MDTEDYLAEINGKIEALTLTCSILISISPDKKEIAQMLTSIISQVENDQTDAPHLKSYTNGIKTIISMLEELSNR
jgi:hypothetical protein